MPPGREKTMPKCTMVEHKPLTQEERFDQLRESIPKMGIKDLVTLYGILMSLKGWEKDAALIKVEIDKRLSNVVERAETAL